MKSQLGQDSWGPDLTKLMLSGRSTVRSEVQNQSISELKFSIIVTASEGYRGWQGQMSRNLTVSADLISAGQFCIRCNLGASAIFTAIEEALERDSTATSVLGQSRHFAARRSLQDRCTLSANSGNERTHSITPSTTASGVSRGRAGAWWCGCVRWAATVSPT
jgi:hypothetical protein